MVEGDALLGPARVALLQLASSNLMEHRLSFDLRLDLVKKFKFTLLNAATARGWRLADVARKRQTDRMRELLLERRKALGLARPRK